MARSMRLPKEPAGGGFAGPVLLILLMALTVWGAFQMFAADRASTASMVYIDRQATASVTDSNRPAESAGGRDLPRTVSLLPNRAEPNRQ